MSWSVLVIVHRNQILFPCHPELVELVAIPFVEVPDFPAYVDKFEDYAASNSDAKSVQQVMNDPNCITLLSCMKDIVAISPCAIEDDIGNRTNADIYDI